MHDGGPNKENISRGRIEAALFADVDPTRRDDTFAFLHSSDKEVWLCYPSRGFSGSGCDKAFIYNYMNNTWYQRNLIPEDVTGDTPNGIRGMEEAELDGELFIYGWGELGPRRLGTERGFSGGGIRTGGNAIFMNKDLGDPIITKSIHAAYPKGSAQFEVGVTSTPHLQDTIVFPMRSFDPNNEYKIDYRLHGRYYHLQLQQSSNLNPKITNCDIDVKSGGRR